MKNNHYIKYIIISLIVSLLIILSYSVIHIFEYRTYINNYNNNINSIVNNVKEKYPDITDTEIISILNDNNKDTNNIFDEYGIDLKKESAILVNEKSKNIFLIINIVFILVVLIITFLIYRMYINKMNKDIKEILKLIEAINKKNYELNIDSVDEGDLSLLKDEIYKTTIMLKEDAENSKEDKLNLKKSLEDISHQLKTPLTSIMIQLDNIIDDPDMDSNTRNEFIVDIRRNIININFLVQAILKLSKLDANTVTFNKEDNSAKKIINESIKNVSPLSDLMNVNIKYDSKKDMNIVCDFKWQVEAISNILKNCIEHSNDGGEVCIKTDNNTVYSLIEISDNGEGISKKDIKHIFERFYKGANSSSDSIGIGLALAKTIIEEDKGTISVESNKSGTKFIIKYYKI